MRKLPFPVLNYIYDLTIADRSPAFLMMTRDGYLRDCGGELELYCIAGLGKGKYVGDHVLVLEGFFPLDDEGLELSCVETETGVFADIHIFFSGKEYWVLFLDARQEEARQAALQQKTNDLSLLRGEHANLLDQYLGKEITERKLLLNLSEAGENRNVAVLFSDIRGFTAYTEQNSPAEVFRVLNIYLAAMIQPVFDEGGIVSKIIGDSVMAIFGLLPSKLSPPHQAVKAGFRILENIDILKSSGIREKRNFDAGIGMASGKVMLGIIGTGNRKTLSAIGSSVGVAASLEAKARAREILICENTFREIAELQHRFSSAVLSLKGGQESFHAYSCATDK